MIVGIGCDIVEHEVSIAIGWQKKEAALNRFFSEFECMEYSKNSNLSYLTGRFAVKEAVLKCLGIGLIDGISLRDIEVHSSDLGQPTIKLKGEVKKLSDEKGVNKWYASISHTRHSSMAYVIAAM